MTAPPARTGKLISLEVARFIAALFVAVNHIASFSTEVGTGRPFWGLTLPPATGVLFFFVLSGFVIHTAHRADSGQTQRVPRYFWRRFWRIYPLYWLSIVAEVSLLGGIDHAGYLVNIFSLSPFVDKIIELNPPAWTLRFELTFYALYGLGLLPYLRRVLLPAWLLMLIWTWYPQYLPLPRLDHVITLPPGLNWHMLSVNNFMFFMGLAAAELYARWQPARRQAWSLLVLGGGALLYYTRASAWGFLYPSVAQMPLASASFACVIFALASLERGGHLRLGPRWGLLGALSYPLYLLHACVTFLVGAYIVYHPRANHALPASALFLGVLMGALVLATAATVLFDRPLQRLVRRAV